MVVAPSLIVVVVLVAMVALFVSDRVPLDLVALMAMCALLGTGVLTTGEALAGFANPIVSMIAGLFVVGAGLQRAGVTAWLGAQLARVGGRSERRLAVTIMTVSALASSFMSSTGTVAILMPVVVSLARKRGLAPGRLLMPLAFASLLGGMLTLIGTPPNIVVSDELRRHGGQGFSFFSFTAPGLVLAVVGIAFLAFVAGRWLPRGQEATDDEAPGSVTQGELSGTYGILDRIGAFSLPPESGLVGQSLAEADLRARFGVTVLAVRRDARTEQGRPLRILPTLRFESHDRVVVLAPDATTLGRFVREAGGEGRDEPKTLVLPPEETMAEVVIPRRSRFAGKTVRDIAFRTRYRSTVLAVQRGGQNREGAVGEMVLEAGDTLLVKGARKSVELLRNTPRDFVVLLESRTEDTTLDARRAAGPLLAMLGMLILMTFRVVPNVLAVLLAAVAMVASKTLTTVEAYRRINWESVVLVAAVLPMATALDKTGLLDQVVGGLVGGLGAAGPRVILATLFVLTSVASQVISNTATTVLVAPVAYGLALNLSLAPEPFLMTVALAASTAFATPIASPVNMLVLNAGGYRFADFMRVGIPLQLVLFAVTLVIVPLMFPF